MAYNTQAKVITNVVIFFKPALWNQWYEDIKSSTPNQLWKYFKSDINATLTKPVEPVMPVDEPLFNRKKSFQIRNVYIIRTKGMKIFISSSSKFLEIKKRNVIDTKKSTLSLVNVFS